MKSRIKRKNVKLKRLELENEKCLISVRHSKKVKNILQGSDK